MLRDIWTRHKGNIGLALLIVYTLSLGVATADEIFHLQLFPTKLDKMIQESIENLDSENPKDRKQARTNLLQYNEFAVPKLVAATDREGRIGKAAMELLRKITDREFDTPEEWKQWYQKHQEDYM
ncbi:MAG: hypothetical protein R6V10_02000 [bacterium]